MADGQEVRALIDRIEIDLLQNGAALQLCRYSEEDFSTADTVAPDWERHPAVCRLCRNDRSPASRGTQPCVRRVASGTVSRVVLMGGGCVNVEGRASCRDGFVDNAMRSTGRARLRGTGLALMTAPWRFGLLSSQTGVTAGIETTQLNASRLAIEQLNAAGGIAGRLIEPVVYDPASNPKRFAACAERLLGTDGIRLLFGCYMSSTRKAVLPLVESYRGLLFYPTLYEGFEYSQHCIYTGAAPNQNSMQLARYLLQNYGNRFFFVGSNYVYPYESNRIMADLVRQGGGVVLDEIYVPLTAPDFSKSIREIARAKPHVIFSTVVGDGTAVLHEAYHSAGFDPTRMPIASLTTSEAEVAEMTQGAAEGHITAAPFFDILTTHAAVEFVSAYRRRFGKDAPVTAGAEAAYFQIMLAAQAIERAGSDDPALVHAALPDCEFEAPQGRVRVDRDNNHTYLWPRVARLGQRKRFEIVWSSARWIKPDPYRITQTLDEWSTDTPSRAIA